MSHSLKLTVQFAPENRPFAPKRKGSSSKHPYSGAFAVSFREGKSQDISISEFKKLHRNSLHKKKSIYLEVKHGETIDRRGLLSRSSSTGKLLRWVTSR